jgi:hypothetical protein
MTWSNLERERYFKLSNINPYEVLEVDKESCTFKELRNNYKKLVFLLHPDKKVDKDDKQFLVLQQCYKYILEENFTDLVKDTIKERSLEDVLQDRNVVYSQEFTFQVDDLKNQNLRKIMIPESDIDLSKEPRENTERKDPIIENFFGKRKKFSLKYFNAVVDAEKEVIKSLVKVEKTGVKPREGNKKGNFAEIVSYDGKIEITGPQKTNPYETEALPKISKKDFNKIISEKMKESRKITKGNYSNLTRENISVRKISEEEMMRNKEKELRAELIKKRDFINKRENTRRELLGFLKNQ